jgi:hypothetical protein
MEMQMKQVMNHNKNNGLLTMIRRSDPMITTGIKRQTLQHGLNIVVDANGKSKKIIIK